MLACSLGADAWLAWVRAAMYSLRSFRFRPLLYSGCRFLFFSFLLFAHARTAFGAPPGAVQRDAHLIRRRAVSRVGGGFDSIRFDSPAAESASSSHLYGHWYASG
ncbi:hypothetical protein C8R45DRAFT_1017732 [Mycena sanguinolenta]|nr:hypothetical protein C8R45DRAFT_1017732 [Mycena sanguinolenta]